MSNFTDRQVPLILSVCLVSGGRISPTSKTCCEKGIYPKKLALQIENIKPGFDKELKTAQQSLVTW